MPRGSPSIDSVVRSVLRLPRQQRTSRLCHLLRRHVRASAQRHGSREVRGTLTGGRSYLPMATGGRRGRRGRGHGRHEGRSGDRGHRTVTLLLDSCTAPGRILIDAPRRFPLHGWTALVRLGDSALAPSEVTSHCPRHGWTCFIVDDGAGPSSSAPAAPPPPPRAPSPRLPMPTPRPERWGTRAACTGWPPYYSNDRGSGGAAAFDPALAPPPPPPAPVPACHNAMVAANRCPGLRSHANGDAGGLPNGHAGRGYEPSSDEEGA
ncbi:hypothetical protein PVAP13_9KG317414 [Panicum virgatum]|uniref:Uncharacterized protein n=1 Tax=Panicum virgatum TaxID=38727 RepID=A0A8T0NVC1_PANVG|nr:hypothetical protein PVAP13_9KG317414 [Panicum virgatum]